jgi:hypothetical protein
MEYRSVDSNAGHVDQLKPKLQERVRRGMTHMLTDVERTASGAVGGVVASRMLNGTAE